MTRKGSSQEELVRAYFARQGFFALRGVSYRYENEEVTDIDVWLYGRQSPSVRTRAIVDVKRKRSPKAFERILWTRGMQLALKCDRAVVATTDDSDKVARYARLQGVVLLSNSFITLLRDKLDIDERLSLEQFIENIQKNRNHKQDGDWLRRISEVKSALVSLHGYPAFNKAISGFRFFSERIQTRSRYREQALRGAYLTAAVACVALDSAVEQIVYDKPERRYNAILNGVTYGDAGDMRSKKSIETVLEVVAEGMENGRVIARRAKDALDNMLRDTRADIIAEYFSREQNAGTLFVVAKELDDRAHSTDPSVIQDLSVGAKSVLGVYADFVRARRTDLLNDVTFNSRVENNVKVKDETPTTEDAATDRPDPGQTKFQLS